MTNLDVALCQVAVSDDELLRDRVARVAGLVRAQRGADVVVLPELWPTGAFAYDAWSDSAEPLDGPTVTAMAQAARDAGVCLHMGSFIERDEAGRLHNTSVLLSAEGEVVAVYRKVHLFGFSEGEPKLLTAGTDIVVADRLGLSTCYDLRFPELYRRLVDAGAEALVVVAGWPMKRAAHWRLLAQARAVEDQCWVLACGTAGTHAGYEMAGGSLVVDPWGAVVAEAGTGEEVLRASVDLDLVAKVRTSFPVLPDRRLG